jgi:hypothetical protein
MLPLLPAITHTTRAHGNSRHSKTNQEHYLDKSLGDQRRQESFHNRKVFKALSMGLEEHPWVK